MLVVPFSLCFVYLWIDSTKSRSQRSVCKTGPLFVCWRDPIAWAWRKKTRSKFIIETSKVLFHYTEYKELKKQLDSTPDLWIHVARHLDQLYQKQKSATGLLSTHGPTHATDIRE